METYERLICDLGHCLLTKGLNNDFTESGRDLGMGVMCTGAWTQRACREQSKQQSELHDLTDIQKVWRKSELGLQSTL